MEVNLKGRLYLQHPLRQSLRVRIPVNATPDELSIVKRRLEWLYEHANEPYPVDLVNDITAHNLWTPKNKCKATQQLPTTQEHPVEQATSNNSIEAAAAVMSEAKEQGASPATEPNGMQEAAMCKPIDKPQEGGRAPLTFKVKEAEPDEELEEFHVGYKKTALDFLEEMDLLTSRPQHDFIHYLKSLRQYLQTEIATMMETLKGVIFWVSIQVRYTHPTRELNEHESTAYLHSAKQMLFDRDELEIRLDHVIDVLSNCNANYHRHASGLVLDEILKTRFKVAKYDKMIGEGYSKLPKYLIGKRAIINVKNDDKRCFGYAILSALHQHQQVPHRPSIYNAFFQSDGLDKISYPVAVADIPAIEDQLGLHINVFSFYDRDGQIRYPLYISKNSSTKEIDLLLWDNHYAWIKSFRRFMSDACGKNKTDWCKKCLGHFSRKQAFERHKQTCSTFAAPGVVFGMPKQYKRMKKQCAPPQAKKMRDSEYQMN